MAYSVGVILRQFALLRPLSLRQALVAGVALAFAASLAGDAGAAARNYNRAQAVGKKRDAPTVNPFGELPKGPLQMVVSIGQQHVTLYANGVRVTQSKVSTGTPGRPTPTGIFSVIEKDRWHRSNLYDSAPMFYMQRLTWSGVAMHEGILPGYAASHGCIRLPTEFASRLWVATKLGVRVVIARNDPVPHELDHPKLFNPKQKPDQVSAFAPIDGLRPSLAANEFADGSATWPIRFAQSAFVNNDATNVAGTPSQESTEASAPAGEGAQVTHSIEAAPAPAAPPIEHEITASMPDTGAATPAAIEPERPGPPGAEPTKPAPAKARAAEPVKKAGQVAVFISKKEQKIFVRQGFVPVFSMPVEIADPDQPLGTHVFTALEVMDGGTRMRWNAITMPPEQPRPVDGRNNRMTGKKPEPVHSPAEVKAPATAAGALERITMPQEAIDRISELLIPGSSLIVSDHGLGSETGRYTEFIVVTR